MSRIDSRPDEQNPEARALSGTHRPSAKRVSVLLCAAVALSIATVGAAGCGGRKTVGDLTQDQAAEAPVNPQDKKVPAEAEAWITQFGSRYEDPLSTYYAATAYESEPGHRSIVMGQEYIQGYDKSVSLSNEISELGFSSYRLPVSAKNNQVTAVKVFNEYTAPQLSIYMNLLAKNPEPEAVAIIDGEFLSLCSNNGAEGTALDFTADDDEISALMSTAKSVVAKYGSNANYRVGTGYIVGTEKDVRHDDTYTEFPRSGGPVMVDSGIDGKKVVSIESNGVRLAVNVELYENAQVTASTESLDDVQLTLIRQVDTGETGYTYLSIGER